MLAEAAADQPLGQGDVCLLDHFPLWVPDRASVMIGPTHNDQVVLHSWDRVRRVGERYLVIVCSQDCDIENPRARTGILLAPLINPPASFHDARYDQIMASHEPHDGMYSWIQLFPAQLPPAMGGQDVVADFSALTTMAKAEAAVTHLLARRTASLTEIGRTRLREKLAFFVGRDPQQDRTTDDR